ncbi:SRPBCC family protein [Streptacidiphilus griseoplanus]|uniref:SRPBCC family protein n=1 Tax=Peterkaempfera griseoplana TaxID=66896 RepID=UPI0006E3AFF3|nr:SRPBCC family protein [Peterkaempfera griseoplana]
MSEYEAHRTMPALPEQVFDEASDLRTMERWLPRELHLEAQRPPAVTVSHGERGEQETALLHAHYDRLRLEWGTRDSGRYSGWLQVTGLESGASEVSVHLTFSDPECAPPSRDVEMALRQSLDRLAEQVKLRAGYPA